LRRNIFYSILAFLGLFLAGAMILHPQSTFQGALYGLKTWALVLVPALLPFIIISDILVELGVVRLLGVLLEPLMRPLFKQPGEAGFVVAMGFTSGFPMGAVLTNTLYEKNLLTREEAGRLLAFTNNSSPLFLLVAIPVGMFNNPHLGVILLLAHYGANLCLGLILGIFGNNNKKISFQGSLVKKSLKELIGIQKNAKPLGSLLGSAVNKSIQNMLTIGGFVIFFAVLIEVFKETNLSYFLTLFFSKILVLIGVNPILGEGITTGFFEMTLGAQKVAQINVSLIQQLMIVSLILGWSGLSIQAQVTSIAARNNLPISYYLGGRFFQGILAMFLTLLLFKPLSNIIPASKFNFFPQENITFFNYYTFSFGAALVVIFILLVLSGIWRIILHVTK
jgi:sporulation integral membrane protein YlbJ